MARKPEQSVTIRDLIVAAGGIVHRDGRVLLVHRPRYNDWSLPKGKVDGGESPGEAALREVREETGWTCRSVQFVGACGYEVKGVPKTVLYWLMEPVSQGPIEDTGEVAEIAWADLAEASRLLTYPLEQEMLSKTFPT